MTNFRLTWDTVSGWVVEKATVGQAEKKDGTPNPNAGVVQWSPYKYPGKSLNRAAHVLIEQQGLEDGTIVHSFEEYKAVMNAAANKVTAALEKLYGNR